MARNTFGGEVTQLVVSKDAGNVDALIVAPGAVLPWRLTPGGAVVTDFLLWDGAAFTIVASSIVADGEGHVPRFQGPDGVTVLYDPTGYALYAQGAAGIGLGTASTANTGTTSGTVPLLGAGGVLAKERIGSGAPAAGTYVDGGTGAWTVLPDAGALSTVGTADLPMCVALFARKVGGVWPTAFDANGVASYTGGTSSTGVRPSADGNRMCIWVGAAPFPPVVTTGTAGMYEGDVPIVLP